MRRRSPLPSPIDFFLVPTLTFRLLFAFVVLRHDRRQLLHVNVTDHPTAAWVALQIVAAFPGAPAPAYLLRDRDSVYGEIFQRRLAEMGMRQILIAPRAPWQNPFAERVIGSIRREPRPRRGARRAPSAPPAPRLPAVLQHRAAASGPRQQQPAAARRPAACPRARCGSLAGWGAASPLPARRLSDPPLLSVVRDQDGGPSPLPVILVSLSCLIMAHRSIPSDITVLTVAWDPATRSHRWRPGGF